MDSRRSGLQSSHTWTLTLRNCYQGNRRSIFHLSLNSWLYRFSWKRQLGAWSGINRWRYSEKHRYCKRLVIVVFLHLHTKNSPLYKWEGNWDRNASCNCFGDRYCRRAGQLVANRLLRKLSKRGQVHNLACENGFYKAEHLTSFWYRGPRELGNGLFF